MMDQEAWNQRTRSLLEIAYVEASTPEGGSGCSFDADGWQRARRPLVEGFNRNGSWLDVGCANGLLLETLPMWLADREVQVQPHGLELIASVAQIARQRLPQMSDRIYTGDIMDWPPPQRWTYVTTMNDPVPPEKLPELVQRLLEKFVEPGGRLIVSSYGSASRREPASPIAQQLDSFGFHVAGEAAAESASGVCITRTAWINKAPD